jgi:hypothetical protein
MLILAKEDRDYLVKTRDILDLKPIVIREKNKISRSRRYVFNAIRILKEKGHSHLTLDKVD